MYRSEGGVRFACQCSRNKGIKYVDTTEWGEDDAGEEKRCNISIHHAALCKVQTLNALTAKTVRNRVAFGIR